MLVLKIRSVRPQRAQAREMNSEFNAVSVTFESRRNTTAYNSEKNESSTCEQ